MSDSDSDFLSPNNVLTFTNNTSSVGRIKGPNFDSNFNLNFNGNSSMMTSNYERQRVKNYDQRSILGHREMSPTMSVRSGIELPPKYQQSFCYGGFAQSSIINGREGRCTSPALSTGSNMSTAASIISAFKSGQFNNQELRTIKNALNKCFKGRVRKKIAKRRNLKLYMKGARRKSGDDSGELGSDSSVSSDDCRSTRTGITMHSNYSQYKSSFQNNAFQSSRVSNDAKSSRTESTYLKKTIKDSIIYKDCSESFKQNSFRNILSLAPKNINSTLNTKLNTTCQKDRFKSNFLLPSQRFAKSTTVIPIPEEQAVPQGIIKNVSKAGAPKQNVLNSDNINSTETDDDNIFFEMSDPERSILKQPQSNKKRSLNSSDESPCFQIKKTKLSNPTKLNQANENNSSFINKHKDDDVFLKPLLPLPKSSKSKCIENASLKPAESRRLAKNYVPVTHSTLNNDGEDEVSIEDTQSKTMLSDVSSRPSFMKRKLFTQTLDVTENKGNSNDSSPGISPQKVYEDISKEKNKARKLVTNQSYLSRDVQREDNQLLDLIHKIVPRQQMNVTTNTTQKIDVHPQKTNTIVKPITNISPILEDRWNITNVISTCNNDDVSDTYTDEEIFNLHNTEPKEKKPRSKTESNINNINSKPCSVVVTKIKNLDILKTPIKLSNNNNVKNNKTVIDLAQAFWNLDSESETPDKQKQQNPTKFIDNHSSFAKRRQDHYACNNNSVKNFKSVLDITESTVKSIHPLEENVQKITNKSLRECNPKEVKNKIKNLIKTTENNVPKNKKIIDAPTDKDSKLGHKEERANKVKNYNDQKCIKNNRLHQDVAKEGLSAEIAQLEVNSSKICKDTNVAVIQKELEVSTFSSKPHNLNSSRKPRGRPRKALNNLSVTPNISSDQDYSNCSKTLRSRTKQHDSTSNKILGTPDSSLNQDSINISNRLRRCRTKETSSDINIPNKSNKKTDKENKFVEVSRKRASVTTKTRAASDNTVVQSNGMEPKLLSNKKKSLIVNKVTPSKLKEKNSVGQRNKNGDNSISKRTKRSIATKSPIKKMQLNNSIRTRSITNKNKTIETPIKKTVFTKSTSNKENVVNGNNTKRKSSRTVKNSSTCYCSETNTSIKPNDVKESKTNDQELNEVKGRKKKDSKIDQYLLPVDPNARGIPDSPKPTVNSFRSDRLETRRQMVGETKGRVLEKSVVGSVKVWGLGFARPTIGVVPPHGSAEEPRYNATVIDDDTKSITVRSVTSLPTRTRRPQFLHVF